MKVESTSQVWPLPLTPPPAACVSVTVATWPVGPAPVRTWGSVRAAWPYLGIVVPPVWTVGGMPTPPCGNRDRVKSVAVLYVDPSDMMRIIDITLSCDRDHCCVRTLFYYCLAFCRMAMCSAPSYSVEYQTVHTHIPHPVNAVPHVSVRNFIS